MRVYQQSSTVINVRELCRPAHLVNSSAYQISQQALDDFHYYTYLWQRLISASYYSSHHFQCSP